MHPAGDAFVKPGVRKGILPDILAALIEARSQTRRVLKDMSEPSKRAILESRQKALKLTANALYGFTGKPLQVQVGSFHPVVNALCLTFDIFVVLKVGCSQ